MSIHGHISDDPKDMGSWLDEHQHAAHETAAIHR
jgi:hypothetical protein